MAPSPWIARFGPAVPLDGVVLDVACGRGRHTRWFLDRGSRVVAIDRDLSGVDDLRDDPRVELIECDLEVGAPFPVSGRTFAAVVVTNYLWRPILDDVARAVAPGGWLLYETFAAGNERLGHPTNPDFLLQPGELLALAGAHGLRVMAYEDLEVEEPRPAMIQRVAATRPLEAPRMSARLDPSWKVVASPSTPSVDRCVDIFTRPDGTFSFEEFRRDAEDMGAWTPVAYYSEREYASAGEAIAAARRSVPWLAEVLET